MKCQHAPSTHSHRTVNAAAFPVLLLLLQAASPDEEALVAGAAYLGTKLVAR